MFAKPMISCEIGTGTSFVNQHQVTGLVVPPADAGELKRAMDVLLRDDETVTCTAITREPIMKRR